MTLNPRKDPQAALQHQAWSSPKERDALITTVLGTGGTRDIALVVDLVFSPDPAVQAAAVERLKKLASAAAIDALMERAPSAPLAQLQAIARALAPHLNRAAIGALIGHLNHPHTATRRLAQETLLGAQQEAPLPLAGSWLTDTGDPHRALLLIEAIARAFKQFPDQRAALTQLARRAVKHPQSNVRSAAWGLLIQSRDPKLLPLIISALPDETRANQDLLVEAVAKLLPRAKDLHIALLPTLLASPQPRLQDTALDLIEQHPDKLDLLDAFLLTNPTPSPRLLKRVFARLGDAALDALNALLLRASVPHHQRLGVALAYLGTHDPRITPGLLAALQSHDVWTGALAADALADSTTPDAIDPLREAMHDPARAWAAVDALGRLACVLGQRNDGRNAARALEPLALILKTGQQRDASLSLDEDPDGVALRASIVSTLRAFPSQRILNMLRQVAAGDGSNSVRAEALGAARVVAGALERTFDDEERLATLINHAIAAPDRLSAAERIMARARLEGASDLYITPGHTPTIRHNNQLRPLADNLKPLSADQAAAFIRSLLTSEQAAEVAREGHLETGLSVPGAGRYRLNVFVDHSGVNATLRVIPRDLPTPATLGIPAPLLDTVDRWTSGLILIAGPSSSGKTTTLAALVNRINDSSPLHLFAVAPVTEFVHAPRRGRVSQHIAPTHSPPALHDIIACQPDVLVLGSLDDGPTTRLALHACEAGMRVLACIDSPRIDTALKRFVQAFPPRDHARVQSALADTLTAVSSQELIPDVNGEAMVAAFAVALAHPDVRHAIRMGNYHAIDSLMQTHHGAGMQTLDLHLSALIQARQVATERALKLARQPDQLRAQLAQPASHQD